VFQSRYTVSSKVELRASVSMSMPTYSKHALAAVDERHLRLCGDGVGETLVEERRRQVRSGVDMAVGLTVR
jgi:TPP-dependent 2-oxoacid decarboxylase